MSARNIENVKRTPGPHDYNNDSSKILTRSPSFTVGTRSKSYGQIIFEQNAYKPGPTSYDSKNNHNKPNGVFIGISKRKDLCETERTPAPNYYNS
jgi:hypothetical protein